MSKKLVNSSGQIVTRAVSFESMAKQYTGCIFKMCNGSYAKIIEYIDKFHVKIIFLDDTHYSTIANLDNIKAGNVKNPYIINSNGGYYGEGDYIINRDPKPGKAWDAMIRRAHMHIPRANKTEDSYINTTVCEEWLCLQTFAKWYIDYRSKINPKYWNELEIDKDILQWNQEFKIYSPQTCCLIPHNLNVVLVGMHTENTRNSNLPIGVRSTKYGRYTVYVSNLGIRFHVGTYNTPEEAFEAYKKAKKDVIIKIALEYYQDGGILEDIYNKILNLEILPF